MKKALSVLAAAACSLAALSPALADNWPAWRGPTGQGISRETDLPLEWSPTKNTRWKLPLPGPGNSTPIVWEQRIFLTQATSKGAERWTWCINRSDGKVAWKKKVEYTGSEPTHATNPYCSASPVTDGERVIVSHGSAGLYCYDLEGEKLWERNLGKVHMGASLGEGCSPVIHDGRLVIVRDQARQSSVHVLNAKTGKTLWEKKREEPNAWATPVVVRHSGRTQVVVPASKMVRCYDLENGKIIWQCGGLTGNVIPSPVISGDLVCCMSGYQGYSLLALPLSAKGDISKTESIAWSKNRGTPYVPSPVEYDGMLYFTQSNRNILTCLATQTGDVIIDRTRLPGLSNIYASPVGADDRIYFTGRSGTTLVLKRSKKLEVLATNKLDERFDSSPSLAGNQLFLRGRKFLYCIAEQK